MTPEKKLEQVEVLVDALIKLNDEESKNSQLVEYDLVVMLKLIKGILDNVQTDLAVKNQLMFAYGLQKKPEL